MTTLSLGELLKDNGLGATVQHELAQAPFGLKTVKHFANYFESKSEVNSLFCQPFRLSSQMGHSSQI